MFRKNEKYHVTMSWFDRRTSHCSLIEEVHVNHTFLFVLKLTNNKTRKFDVLAKIQMFSSPHRFSDCPHYLVFPTSQCGFSGGTEERGCGYRVKTLKNLQEVGELSWSRTTRHLRYVTRRLREVDGGEPTWAMWNHGNHGEAVAPA